MSEPLTIYLCRHGETAWSLSGQHTGHTDIPLTPKGRDQARRLHKVLAPLSFTHVYASPLQRARETAELAGFSKHLVLEPLAKEWDYGEYEGLTSEEIAGKNPKWDLFAQGAPKGETVAEVAARADALIGKWEKQGGKILLFSHGHFLRTLAMRWIHQPPALGAHFTLAVATLSHLGYEKANRAILSWNSPL